MKTLSTKSLLVAGAVGGALFFAGEAFFTRRAIIARGERELFGDRPLFEQFWMAAPDLAPTLAVGALGGMLAAFAVKNWGGA